MLSNVQNPTVTETQPSTFIDKGNGLPGAADHPGSEHTEFRPTACLSLPSWGLRPSSWKFFDQTAIHGKAERTQRRVSLWRHLALIDSNLDSD
jgi:hypothetical protein